jgi:hypothetical protein
MPPLLGIETENQNICCDNALRFLKDSKITLDFTYRQIVREQWWDVYCKTTKTPTNKAFVDLDAQLSLPYDILSKINYKFKCTELCPFPECLEELHASERELILNYRLIEDILGWINIGLTMEKVAQWHGVPISDVRRWNAKHKKITDRLEIYKGFQDYLAYL